jgi:hypothetical protein
MLFQRGDFLSEEAETIIVYPNRRRTLVWLILGVASSLIFVLGIVVILILVIVYPALRNVGAVFLALLLLGIGGVVMRATRDVANVLRSGPMLVIAPEGVWVGKLYGPFEIVLPWQEIAAIYLREDAFQQQLFIRPTNVPLFLSRFSPFMRYFLRMNLTNGAPIAIAQSFLDQPIRDILAHVQL